MTLIERLSHLSKTWSPSGRSRFAPSDALRAQLYACLPERLGQVLAQHHRRLVIEPEETRARVHLVAGPKLTPLGEIGLQDGIGLTDLLPAFGKDGRPRCELSLPRTAVLTRTLSFPPQVRDKLPQVIRYELDRLSPFQAEDIVFDYRLIGTTDQQRRRLAVELAICQRKRITPWITRLAEMGSPLARISWDGAWARANLLPPEARPRQNPIRVDPTQALALLIALLVLAVMATPLWQKSQILEQLDQELRRARTQAIAVDELRQQLEQTRQGNMAALQLKLEQPPFLELLRELTDRLPDDTWIQNLEYSEGQVDLSGESGQATALIALLEEAPGIDGVSFKSPVTQVARTGKERFNISFRFAPRSEE